MVTSDLEVMSRSSKSSKSLQPYEIDAFWLQRKLSKIYEDPTQAQTKVKEIIDILKEATDERDVENQLVLLLGFNQFEFIKLLRSNRQMGKFCFQLFLKNFKHTLEIILKKANLLVLFLEQFYVLLNKRPYVHQTYPIS